MVKGFGLDGLGDGIVYKNVLATYTHLHALGTPGWAQSLVEQAERYKIRGAEESLSIEGRGTKTVVLQGAFLTLDLPGNGFRARLIRVNLGEVR